MLVPKNTEKGGGGFLALCTDLEMWKKGYFFSFQLCDIVKKGMFFWWSYVTLYNKLVP